MTWREGALRRADVWINTTPARPLSHAGRDASPPARSHFMAAHDKRNIRLGRRGILRVNLAALIPCSTLFPPRPAGRHCTRTSASTKILQFYRRGRRLDIKRSESAAVRAAQLDPQTPAHPQPPAGGLLLHRRHPPPTTHPIHSLAPSLQCANVWHGNRTKKKRERVKAKEDVEKDKVARREVESRASSTLHTHAVLSARP